MADLGLVGMNILVKYGGLGADAVTIGLVTEITTKGDFNNANGLLNQWLDCEVVSKNGNDKMKEEWLPQVAAAEKKL